MNKTKQTAATDILGCQENVETHFNQPRAEREFHESVTEELYSEYSDKYLRNKNESVKRWKPNTETKQQTETASASQNRVIYLETENAWRVLDTDGTAFVANYRTKQDALSALDAIKHETKTVTGGGNAPREHELLFGAYDSEGTQSRDEVGKEAQ